MTMRSSVSSRPMGIILLDSACSRPEESRACSRTIIRRGPLICSTSLTSSTPSKLAQLLRRDAGLEIGQQDGVHPYAHPLVVHHGEVAEDDAVVLHALDAVPYRGRGALQLGGDLVVRHPAVVDQELRMRRFMASTMGILASERRYDTLRIPMKQRIFAFHFEKMGK